MSNLSQQKRDRMIGFLKQLKDSSTDESVLMSIAEIENELLSKKYGLVWEQHEEQVDVMMRDNVPVFTEVADREIVGNPDSTDYNFLLEGDNLHSLKLLEKTHKGMIDVIYIDPPYNTGNRDFIYNDTYVEAIDGFRHSKWISFMYERLLIARNLLGDKGVLVISIGYQEVNNLMLLCEELFFNKQVTCVTVQTSGGKPNGGFNISQEYLVFITPLDFEPLEIEDAKNVYSSPYHGMNLATFNQTQRPNQAYPIFVDEKGAIQGYGKSLADKVAEGSYIGELADYKYDYSEAPEGTVAVYPVTAKGEPCVWRLIGPRLMSDWSKGYIKVVTNSHNDFVKTGNKYSIQYLSGGIIEKIESGEFQTYKPCDEVPTLEVTNFRTAGATIPTIWTNKVYYTTNGSNQIKEMLNSKEFPYPKPLALIEDILKRITSDSSLVLDFFAGSGTTGQAVLNLNEQLGGNRRFILCTNNQNNICENISFKRLLTVSKGYTRDNKSEKILYEHTLRVTDLEDCSEYLQEAKDICADNLDKYDSVKVIVKDGKLLVQAVEQKGTAVKGIKYNLKYYKTEFIAKKVEDDFYSVGEELEMHIKELIQLERGISLDDGTYQLVLTDEDADNLEKTPELLANCKGIYISGAVFLTKQQEQLFANVPLLPIPDYYFEEELKEVGEL